MTADTSDGTSDGRVSAELAAIREPPDEIEPPRADTDCACPVGDDCPCEADGEDGLCACCRDDDREDSHRGICAGMPAAFASGAEYQRARKLAEARQQIAHEGTGYVPPWGQLTAAEHEQSALAALWWLRAYERALTGEDGSDAT